VYLHEEGHGHGRRTVDALVAEDEDATGFGGRFTGETGRSLDGGAQVGA